MSVERVFPASRSAIGQLGLELREFASPETADYLAWHEGMHFFNDELGYGDFGFVVMDNTIMAFYRPKGFITDKRMMEIAVGPGFSDMSQQDLFIYDICRGEWLREEQWKEYKEKFQALEEKYSSEKPERSGMSVYERELEQFEIEYGFNLVEVFAEKFKEYVRKGVLPEKEEIIKSNFGKFIGNYGEILNQAFEEARKIVNNPLLFSNREPEAEEDKLAKEAEGNVSIVPER